MKRFNALAMFSTLALALAVPSFTACTDADSGDDIELAEPTDEVERWRSPNLMSLHPPISSLNGSA
jgi:hypothetical protein